MFWAREISLNQGWPCCYPMKIYPDFKNDSLDMITALTIKFLKGCA